MSFNLHKYQGSRRRTHEFSDINVTPFVDVMLVILIVFMATAPMLNGVNVNLPKGSNRQIAEPTEPISVTVASNEKVYIDQKEIPVGNLVKYLKQKTNGDKGQKIYVRGDQRIEYGIIMNVINIINRSGYNKVVLVTEDKSN